MAKIKTGDEVIVIAGRSKGHRGKVMRVLPTGRVYVAGAQMHKKHMKPNPKAGREGGIVERERSLDISNVAILNPSTNKADRVGYQKDKEGNKARVFKSNKELIDG